MAGLDTQQAQAEKALQDATSVESAQGINEQRQAVAEWRRAQAARQPLLDADAKAKLDATNQENAQKAWEADVKEYTKGREEDSAQLNSDDPLVAQLQATGYQIIPNRVNPTQVLAIPPVAVHVTADMLPYLLGAKLADLIPFSEVAAARKNFAQQQIAGLKNDPLSQMDADRYNGMWNATAQKYGLPPNQFQVGMTKDDVQKTISSMNDLVGKAQGAQNITIKTDAGNNKTDTAAKQAAFKAYSPAMDSAERFNVMAENYENAVKSNDQQAMLSLLANHLGMTMGLQKGARLNRDAISEAIKSRPWLQGMGSKFDSDGYLTGVTLTPEQMRQMVGLGQSRFSEDISKARNEAKYMGATDDGPEHTSQSYNSLHALAQGNAEKAKQLAATDGWTIH